MRKRLLKKRSRTMAEEVARLRKENAQLKARIEELERRLNQNSRNSSKPSSSDPPWTPPKPPKPRSGRKPGAQPGHPAHQRELVPPEEVTKTIPVKPDKCEGCGAPLSGNDPNPHRHQVTAIPEIKPTVTEWQLHTLTCGRCQEETTAALPEGVPVGAFSPRTVAIASLLTGFYRLSRRTAEAMLFDLFGLKMCLGSVTASEQTTSAAVQAPVAEARDFVKKQNVKGADETSWYQGPQRSKVWLWAACTTWVTVFLIRPHRGTKEAKDLLGKAFGVLITDRWCAYLWWPLKWRQLCWAHIKRHFQEFVDAGGASARIGATLLKEQKQLFEWWRRVRDGPLARGGPLARSTFRVYVAPLRQRVRVLLQKGTTCGHGPTEAKCREILKLEPALWTFVRVEGVDPTNNCSERVIRPGVLWRKICFGTHSEAGSRFAERMLTVTCTLRQQGRNVVDYVTRCVEARQRGDTPPSLLPTSNR